MKARAILTVALIAGAAIVYYFNVISPGTSGSNFSKGYAKAVVDGKNWESEKNEVTLSGAGLVIRAYSENDLFVLQLKEAPPGNGGKTYIIDNSSNVSLFIKDYMGASTSYTCTGGKGNSKLVLENDGQNRLIRGKVGALLFTDKEGNRLRLENCEFSLGYKTGAQRDKNIKSNYHIYFGIFGLIAAMLFLYNAYTGIVHKKAVLSLRFDSGWLRSNETGTFAVIIGIVSLLVGIGLAIYSVYQLVQFI